jgi:cytochrome c oxidase cbb3-type subunit 3
MALLLAALLSACSREARILASDQPQTPPRGAADPRAALYADNAYQASQGGRYFTWYGCGGCHHAGGVGDLAAAGARMDGGRLYSLVANGHGQPAGRIPTEQIWQISGYVRSLPTIDRALSSRQERDLRGEPQGDGWAGALR